MFENNVSWPGGAEMINGDVGWGGWMSLIM
jgi:hypothetical protein